MRLAHPLYGEILRHDVATMTRRRLLLERIESIESMGARRREDVVTIASAYLDATGSADPELLLSAAWFARFNHDNVQVERLARAAASDGISPESGLLLGEVLHDLARYDEAGEVLTEAISLVESDDRVFAPLVEMTVRNLMWGLHRTDAALALLRNMRDRTSDQVIRNELVAEEGMVLSYSGRTAEALAVLGVLTDDVHPARGSSPPSRPSLRSSRRGSSSAPSRSVEGAYEDHVQLSEHIAMARPHVHMSFHVEALAYLGRLDESTALATRCYENIPVDAPANAALWFVVRLGRNAMLRGQLHTARRWLAEGVARCERRDAGPRRVVLSLLATAAAWMGDVDAANAAVDEIDTLPPFSYLPGEQLLGPAWAAAASGALPRARDLLVAAADQLRASGHHAMEAWLLHDACRLGQHGTSARLTELAELCEGSLIATWALHTSGVDSGRASELVAATGQLEDIGAYLLAAETATEATHALQRDGDQRGAATMRARGVVAGRRVRVASHAGAHHVGLARAADGARARDLCAGGHWCEQSGDRVEAVPVRPHGEQPPTTRLRQARRHQPPRAGGHARSDPLRGATPGRLTTVTVVRRPGVPFPYSANGRARSPRWQSGDSGTGHLDLTALVGELDLEIDEVLVVVLALAGDGDLRGERLAGPRLLREPDLEVAQVADADPVGDRPTEQPHREHAVTEHARQARFLGLHLVVVHRIEVTGRTRVHHEIGSGQDVADHRRLVALVDIVEEQLLLCH